MAFTNNKDGLVNRIELSGQLVSIDSVKKDITSTDKTPYISFRGKVRTGETSVSDISFRAFVKKKNVEPGKISNYDKVSAWLEEAHSIVDVGEASASWVTLVGSVTDEPYMKQDGNMSDYPTFNINLFNMQKSGKTDKHAYIDLAGSLYRLTDEAFGDDQTPTGNKKLELVSRDFFGKTLHIKNIVVVPEVASELEGHDCAVGITATFKIDIVEIKSKRQPIDPSKGFNLRDSNSTEGFGRTIWKLMGFDTIYTDDESVHYLTKATVKQMLAERESRIAQIKQEGYKGGSKQAAPAKVQTRTVAPLADDDDLPY